MNYNPLEQQIVNLHRKKSELESKLNFYQSQGLPDTNQIYKIKKELYTLNNVIEIMKTKKHNPDGQYSELISHLKDIKIYLKELCEFKSITDGVSNNNIISSNLVCDIEEQSDDVLTVDLMCDL